MFTIESAVSNWKLQLSQRQTMTPADIEEMETHLRDEMETLQSTGLSAEEAFLVASRRIGDCDQVAGEFAKVNAMVIWRNRFFWMIGGILAASILSSLAGLLGASGVVLMKLGHLGLDWFWTGIIGQVASFLVMLALGYGVYRLIPSSPSLWRAFARRKVLAAITLGPAAILLGLVSRMTPVLMIRASSVQDYGQFSMGSGYTTLGLSLLGPLMLAALLIFLMPDRTRKA